MINFLFKRSKTIVINKVSGNKIQFFIMLKPSFQQVSANTILQSYNNVVCVLETIIVVPKKHSQSLVGHSPTDKKMGL